MAALTVATDADVANKHRRNDRHDQHDRQGQRQETPVGEWVKIVRARPCDIERGLNATEWWIFNGETFSARVRIATERTFWMAKIKSRVLDRVILFAKFTDIDTAKEWAEEMVDVCEMGWEETAKVHAKFPRTNFDNRNGNSDAWGDDGR